MKLLLIGGTGIISTEISRLAIKNGVELYLLNRGRRDEFIPDGARCLIADIKDDEAVKGVIGNLQFDVVADFLAYRPEDIKRHLSLLAGRYAQYIFISSATVYSREDQITPIREGVTPITNVLWDYSRNKIACEKYLEKYDDLYGLNYTIVRPYVTYGDTRIPFPLVSHTAWTIPDRILRGVPLLLPERGDNICTLTSSADFAEGFMALCMNERAYREAFHITSGNTYSWRRVAEIIGEYLGKNVKFETAPIRDISLGIPMEYGDTYSILKGDKATTWHFDNTKIKSIAPKFTCPTTLEKGLEKTIKFYLDHKEKCVVDDVWNKAVDNIILQQIDLRK